jgi:hypothetical protein
MIDECGTVGGMRIGRGHWSTRRKPAPVRFCPPQIPHDLTRALTRAAAVGSRRLTAWAMTRPKYSLRKCFLQYEIMYAFFHIFLNSHSRGWSPNSVHLARRPLINLLYLPRVIDRMTNWVEWRLARKTEVLGEKPAPAPLYPPQIPHGLTWALTRAAAVGSRRLTAWAMTRPSLL